MRLALKAIRWLFIITIIAVYTENSFAADLYVSKTGSNTAPYGTPATAARSIQVAVDYANNSGDIVWILPGTYLLTSQVLVESKSITIRSRDGRDVTIVDAQNRSRCFSLLNSLAILHDLTIRNGVAPVSTSSDSGESYGGGVVCDFGGVVSRCIIENCSADYGGGIRLRGFGEVKDGCIIRNNQAEKQGGGVQLADPQSQNSILEVSGSEIYGNQASGSLGKGGGVYCYRGGSIQNSTIHDNSALVGGGVRLLYEGGVTPSITRSKIYNNSADLQGGGVQVLDGGSIINSLIYDNTSNFGGGVYLYDGGDIHSSTICDNSVSGSNARGGGLYVRTTGTIKNSIIYLNSSSYQGPNYWNDGTSESYQNCAVNPWINEGNNISGLNPDIDFVDRSSRNYYLKSTSICIDAGGTSEAPEDDYPGVARPLDGLGDDSQMYDIGAYEYWGADDIDGDGMPTYWELANGFDPRDAADGTNVLSDPPEITDADLDHLFNVDEYEAGTDPNDADTDGDGISDWEELRGRYPDPLAADGFITDPTKVDSDGDSFDDKYETDNDSNPTNALSLLTSLSGSVSYSGSQAGQVIVLVSNANVAVRMSVIPSPGGYIAANLPTLEPLLISAFRDSDGDGEYDSWEAYGEHVDNPVTLTGPAFGKNIVMYDPTTDSDGDGLSDFFEVYTSHTSHTNNDTDGDFMWDGWEWENRPTVDPTNALDGVSDNDNDELINRDEFLAQSDPDNVDSDGDGMWDGWEWVNRPATDPTNGLDGVVDYEPDGLSNSNEYIIGTNPKLEDSDFDGMPDGWEAMYIPSLSPLTNDAAAGLDAPDYDNLSNINEYLAGTDPTDADSDDDDMPDGWEWSYSNAVNPTNSTDRDLDYDEDGLSNYLEYENGTNPEVKDTDGDTVSDGDEVAAGSDPTDINSFPVSISGTLDYSGVQTGLYFAVASQQPTGQVYMSSAITNLGAYSVESVAMFTNYYMTAFLDSNGNASQDVWEATGIFSDTNGIPVLLYLTNIYTGADITLYDNHTNDFDGDGLTDMDEFYVYGTDPVNPDTDGDSMWDGWESLYTNACDPLDGGDGGVDYEPDGLFNTNEFVHRTNPEVSDSDGDGLTDHQEISGVVNGSVPTDPNNPDSDGDGLTDGEEVGIPPAPGIGTDPNEPDSDGDGFEDGEEFYAGSDPLNTNSFLTTISGDLIYTNGLGGTLYAIATNSVGSWTNSIASPGAYSISGLPTLTNYVVSAFRDSNTNGVKDTWEAQGVYTNNPVLVNDSVTNINLILTHPTVDSDGDLLSDYDEINLHDSDPNNPDTDGDSMWDGWEVSYSNVNHLVGDGQTDLDNDNLSSSNEYVWGTSPDDSDSDSDNMPDGWEVLYSDAVNPTNGMDGAVDYLLGETNALGVVQADGLVNSNEYKYGTSPLAYDTDGDGVGDGDEVAAGTTPTDPSSYPVSISGMLSYTGLQSGPVYAVLAEGTNFTSNVVTIVGNSGLYIFNDVDTLKSYTISGFRDSNTNDLHNTWEASGSYSNAIAQPTNIVVGADFEIVDPILLDSDSDGLTDMNEVYVYGTRPDDDDTDDDFMPDGWEVAYSNAISPLSPLVADGTNDFDADGLVNSNEYNASTIPSLWDSDFDSMPDGWEFEYNACNPTNPADGSFDLDLPNPDGLSNSNEYIWGTSPDLEDTDFDSMPDGWEILYTNALDPTVADGTNDWVGEVGGQDGLSNSNEFIYSTSPELFDSDSDGVGDGAEVDAGSNPTNTASYPVQVDVILNNLSAAVGQTYFVLNSSSNGNVFASYDAGVVGPGFTNAVATNVPNLTTYWPYAFIDINSNATYETFEPYGDNGSITPTNSMHMGIITITDSTLDYDNDGLPDYHEEYIYFTSHTNADTDADGFSDGDEALAPYPSDPLDPNSFHAQISGTTSYSGTLSGVVNVVITNELVDAVTTNATFGAYATATNFPTLTNYYVMAYIDENTNSVMDLWEPRGYADTYPIYLVGDAVNVDITILDSVTDTDGDGLSDYLENYTIGSSPTNNDSDGDLMLDGWEWKYNSVLNPTDPSDPGNDPDGDGLTNLQEHNLDPQTDPTLYDTDGDGLSDKEEVDTYGTEPTIADTDNDGMPDGWEVQYISMLDPLTADAFDDPDGEGLYNLQEYEDSSTDPTNPDSDGEGLTDFEEHVTYGTDPNIPDTDGDGFDDYDEVINIGSKPMNSIDPWVVDDDALNDPAKGDPDESDPDMNGTIGHPYDSIQRAIDAASDGYVVLVLDGLYTGFRNRDIDPKGKEIIIRSYNGADVTRIENGFGGGFICNTGEGTNTVIRGFKVLTSVALNGDPGIVCDGTSPLILECKFVDCSKSGIRCQNGAEPIIRDCTFSTSESAVSIISSDPLVERCTMLLNTNNVGGGMWISGSSSPRIINCVIAHNTATEDGGGVYVGSNAVPVFINCTIADNVAANRGGGVFISGSMHFGNGILWGNTAADEAGFFLDDGQLNAEYCRMQTFHPNTGNDVANPLFVGASDYNLRSTSPCIDQGSTTPISDVAPTMDRDGKNRIYTTGGRSVNDIGAYEYYSGGTIAVQNPGSESGQTLTAGLPTTIEWTWQDGVGASVNLEYTYDFLSQSPTWNSIASGVFRGATNGVNSGAGSYLWTVPQTNTSRCYVRVTDSSNNQITGVSLFEFAIADGIRVLAPDGGETFYIGDTMNVQWASSAASNANVNVILNSDGDRVIEYGVTHTGGGAINNYNWNIPTDDPDLFASNGYMRIAYDDGSLEDLSNESFEILGLVISQPIGGSGVATGSTVNVMWDSLGAGASVDISLSTNAGLTYVSISNGVACVDGANTFSWNVGETLSSNAVIQIESTSDASVIGITGEFVISNNGLTADVDGDGMTDIYEIDSGLNHESGSGENGADGDPDGDGFVNRSEMIAGTDPLRGDSFIGILSFDEGYTSNGNHLSSDRAFSVSWAAVIGREYRVDTTTSWVEEWVPASGTITATSEVMTWTSDLPVASSRFFKIIVLE